MQKFLKRIPRGADLDHGENVANVAKLRDWRFPLFFLSYETLCYDVNIFGTQHQLTLNNVIIHNFVCCINNNSYLFGNVVCLNSSLSQNVCINRFLHLTSAQSTGVVKYTDYLPAER